mmetsp:Transcript_40306/g.91265  ORF Transcript_40306/g.91265 Transcript_40306/m.91265 type:complete len:252 (-) Transcript_40306:493-1248(-)
MQVNRVTHDGCSLNRCICMESSATGETTAATRKLALLQSMPASVKRFVMRLPIRKSIGSQRTTAAKPSLKPGVAMILEGATKSTDRTASPISTRCWWSNAMAAFRKPLSSPPDGVNLCCNGADARWLRPSGVCCALAARPLLDALRPHRVGSRMHSRRARSWYQPGGERGGDTGSGMSGEIHGVSATEAAICVSNLSSLASTGPAIDRTCDALASCSRACNASATDSSEVLIAEAHPGEPASVCSGAMSRM